FAISTTEIPRREFIRFYSEAVGKPGNVRDVRPPMRVNWYDAAHFCNWLSESEGLESCYRPNPDGAYDEGMGVVDEYLSQSGYRLPTEPEWEFACRADVDGTFAHGADPALLDRYAWYDRSEASPVALLRPNRFGLFDMLGNMWEWTNTPDSGDRPKQGPSKRSLVRLDNSNEIVMRGGGFRDRASVVRCSCAYFANPHERALSYGFRIVRTLP
ncbi:formylglycine-generating enzyme family protein, partial [Planctomycetota bacterium]